LFDPDAFQKTLGDAIEPSELANAMARAVCRLVRNEGYGYAHFERAFRAANGRETVIFAVDVERPQRLAAPIARWERMAAVFQDDLQPPVYALRPGFPTEALHLNLGGPNDPPWLCLDDRSWDEAHTRWTALTFLERIRWWLAATARGDLHGEAQPAEPIFSAAETLIIPAEVLTGNWTPGRSLEVVATSDTRYHRAYVMREASQAAPGQATFIPIFLRAAAQKMQRLRAAPHTLDDLHELLTSWGIDLVGELRTDLKRLLAQEPAQMQAHPLLLLYVPLLHVDGTDTGQADLKAFSVGDSHTLASLGVELGVFHREGNAQPVLNLQPDPTMRGTGVNVGVIAVQPHFDRRAAAAGAGMPADERTACLIGGGAIGSHLVDILRRDGFGRWSVIDSDIVLPHNLQRHIAMDAMVGRTKAQAVADVLNWSVGAEGETQAIVANVLGQRPESESALATTNLIVDASASIPVARFLSDHKASNAARLSVFFNTVGRDVVLIGEDSARVLKLDALEAQYYRAVLEVPELSDHITAPGNSYRYATSCRSVSFQMPEHRVAMLAGAIAGEVRRHLDTQTPTITIFRGNDGGLARMVVRTFPVERCERGGWEIILDDGILQAAGELRAAALPSETGGILLGTIDVARRQICVVKLVPAPSDSFGDRAGFERGTQDLAAIVVDAYARTAGQVEYVGEWHSHPKGVAPTVSETDIKQLVWLGSERAIEDLPAIMLIVGDRGDHSLSTVIKA